VYGRSSGSLDGVWRLFREMKLDQGEIVVALEIELLLSCLLLEATNCEGFHRCKDKREQLA